MKEKTFKDLGLDEGDKYLKKIASEFDLGELDNLLSGKEDQTELEKDERYKRQNIRGKDE